MQKKTPLMEQYWSIKSQHRDKILLFRMGDFFEMFDKDAEKAAPLLNIALTARNKKANNSTKMCGVPHHSIAGPVSKLLAAGLNVAICDQIEPPGKGLVKRAVTKILSPGMVYDPETLDQLNANYMAAFEGKFVSFLDSSTGVGFYYEIEEQADILKLFRLLQPSELIVTEDQKKQLPADMLKFHITAFHEEDLLKRADLLTARQTVGQKYQQSPSSLRRLVGYMLFMQGESALHLLNEFEYRNMKKEMYCSSRLHEHLETFKNCEGSFSDSLFTTINRTKTPGGARQLKKYLQSPLTDPKEISRRWDKIDWWKDRPALLDSVRKILSSLGDGERKLGKLTHTHCHGRDILAVGEVLSAGLHLHTLIKSSRFQEEIKQAEQLKNQIFRTIQPTAPISFKEGGVINKGVRPDLDECINLTRSVQSLLSNMEQAERQKTGIPSLKIRYNNIFGYYIEVTKTHSHKIPSSYNRKQTLVHAERYITTELQALEGKVLSARARQIQIEQEIFQSLKQEILNQFPILLKLCHHWNQMDVFSSLAFSAIENKYVRPSFGNKLLLVNNRHPVLERKSFGAFVPNTVEMNPGETLILTGPNMAGKSTLMRGTALTVLLAQSGCFVPADKAELPVFHKIFTRIGANDSLSRGLSTFMVEMKEMAEILEHADCRSLVILDEIGRGTATFDGMSLARAILEFLTNEKKSILLSATHYHELTTLAEEHPSIHNGSMNIEEKDGEIHFLYTLSKGPVNKSYGIQVARLAGLPSSVIRKAKKFLQKYESTEEKSLSSEQMNLFPVRDSHIGKSKLNKVNSLIKKDIKSRPDHKTIQTTETNCSNKKISLEQTLSEIEKEISGYSLNEVTPLDAMNQISNWQKKLKNNFYS